MSLFMIIFLSIIGIIISVQLYQIFLADWIDGKLSAAKDEKTKFASVNRIAMIKMVSDDPKDIEKFVTSNVEYLSDQTVQQFVDRIETLKADSAIRLCDNSLKQRIEEATNIQEEEKVSRAKTVR